MGFIVSEVGIARPPDEVFAYATEPSRFGEWQSGVVSAHIEGDGPTRVGSRCVMTRRIGRAERTLLYEVTQIMPPRIWAIRGIDGPIREIVRATVDPVSDGQDSRVTVRLDFHGHGVGKLLLPMVVRQARRELPQYCQNLKERLENR